MTLFNGKAAYRVESSDLQIDVIGGVARLRTLPGTSDNTVTFRAAENGSDDWVRLNALVAEEFGPLGRQRTIRIANGVYRMVGHAEWPDNTHIEGEGPGVSIVCAVPNPSTIPNYRGPFVVGVRALASDAELSTDYAVGVSTIVVSATIAPQRGQCVNLTNNDTGNEGFEVIKVTNSGPDTREGYELHTLYTLKLSHELSNAYPRATTQLVFWAPARNIKFIGNGAKISGVAERALSIACAYDCLIDGWCIDGDQFTEYLCSIDTASERSLMRNIYATNVRTIAACIEYGFDNRLRNVYAELIGGMAAGAWGRCGSLEQIACVGSKTPGELGIQLGPGKDLRVDGFSVTNCFSGLGATNVSQAQASNGVITNGTLGVVISGTATIPTDLIAENVRVSNFSEGTYRNEAYGTFTTVNCEFRRSVGGSGFLGRTQPTCSTSHHLGVLAPDGGVVGLSGYGTLNIEGVFIDARGMLNNAQPVIAQGSKLRARNVKFAHTAHVTAYCFVGTANAVLDLGDTETIEGNPSNGVALTDDSATVWNRGNADFAAAVTPYSVLGRKNFGTIVLNGTTPVAIPFPAATARNRLFFNRKTAAGTLGELSGSVTAGVGASIVSNNAADTSTIEYQIV